MKVLMTGSQGFIGSYLCNELLGKYEVYGVDNFSKYGELTRPHDRHPNFKLFRCDVANSREFLSIMDEVKPDYIVALSALIGGIAYFHEKSYDLLSVNERILSSTFDAAIHGWKEGYLKKIVPLSSSMVFENVDVYPTPESMICKCPPPSSTYGMQKLMVHYFCQGAYEQYGLPSAIPIPYNCVGVGEEDALGEKEIMSGNVRLMMSHILPDLINKALLGQNPLHILGKGNQTRCYTNGRDLARGIRLIMESDYVNECFNISTPVATTVLELAELVWRKTRSEPFSYVCDEPYKFDVQKRVPDVQKAKRMLGFEAVVTLEESVDEVIAYMKSNHKINNS